MYKQLTLEQRYQISYGLQHEHSYRDIAKTIGCSATTIFNEVKRNSNSVTGKYTPLGANRKCRLKHRDKAKKIKITDEVWQIIHHYLKIKYSPEQICNTVKEIKELGLSPKSIYAYIKRHYHCKDKIYNCLRRRGKKYHKRSKPVGKLISRIPNRTSIHERPKEVEEKKEIGHWEVDTIQGKGRYTAIMTLVERVTGYNIMIKLKGKGSQSLAQRCINAMLPYKDNVKTLTFDNGVEFIAHEKIADALECKNYFADPHSPWQRGLNENTNGLIRQYFPKGKCLKGLTKKQVRQVQEELNHRPRKTRGYHSPYELFHRVTVMG